MNLHQLKLTMIEILALSVPWNLLPSPEHSPLFWAMATGASGALLATAWNWRQKAFQLFVRMVVGCFYRVRVVGAENWPAEGGAVVIGNHATWLDGILFPLYVPRRMHTIALSGNFNTFFMKRLAAFTNCILITANPKSLIRGLQQANQAVRDGELVGIFPEGGISRTGQIQSFRSGVMKVLRGTDAPVVPLYIDQTWGSIFSYSGGKAIWKLPKSIRRRPISISIGKPLENPDSIFKIRQSLQQLGATVVSDRHAKFVSPAQSFVRQCKRRKFKFKAADSTGTQLSGGSLLMKSLILRRLIKKHALADGEKFVGVLLPPSVGGVVTNMALALDRRVAVNLNYTVSNSIMNQCIEMAGIKHVLTSRKVMEKFNFEFACEVVFLEDLRPKLALTDKLAGGFAAFAMPAGMLEFSLGLNQNKKDDVLTLIFTSGSTGIPKAVMLTHENIATNVTAIDQVVKLTSQDTLIGVLPLFHSFGYTVTLWGAMSLNISGVYHFSPLEAMQIGKLCQKHNVTILLATPTFLRTYLRKCTTQHFHALDVVVAGAEKLPVELCDAFEKKFGVRPVEGYGTTELSPLVSVNVPPSRRGDNYMIDCKEGTVGRPVPNVAAKTVGVDSGEELDVNQEGVLWITGPNVMKGYLNQPEKTNEVLQNGWYNTGDMAMIDEDGFIKITGRISRFSKIGGEMVPHVIVEETLSKLLDEDEQDELRFAVTAVPHDKKGERLVVLHTKLKKTPDEYCAALSAAGLPNIFIPSVNSFLEVEQLPLLGTGKLDLRKMKELALQMVSKK